MLAKRNLLENVSIISCSGTIICIILHYVIDISPLKGVWFLAYLLSVFLFSILFSFKVLHWLLHLNKPLKYDLEGFVREYPYLSFVAEVLPKVPKREVKECIEYDTNELSVITTVLERKLVSSWYVPYISQEISFPFACKQMLDQMIGKAFQICNKIETKDVYIDVCVILTSHLNEYKKALKRHEKAPSNSIEYLYKTSHNIFDTTKKLYSADHCTNILRVVLKYLVPWELWDSPQSELLVRILAKKLDSFIDTSLADPAWLNDQLLNILKEKPKDTKPNNAAEPPKENTQSVEVKDLNVKAEETKAEAVAIETSNKNSAETKEPLKVEQTTVESALSTITTKTTAPILPKPIIDELVESAEESQETVQDGSKQSKVQESGASQPVEIKLTNSPVLRQKRGRQGRNEVKIYDRIIEGSIKTWETDLDLQCISVGQDLLAQLDGEMTLSRLWGQDNDEASPNPPRSDPGLWFGEEELDLELEASKERSPIKKDCSPKPADAILKDIQTTVNQAKTKIGDLQDEAAGMMEGLLDFGIAGLKKGLRFTGLGDDQDKSPTSQTKDRPVDRQSPPEALKNEANDIILGMKELNGNGVPLLVKQNRVTSQDSMGVLAWRAESPEPQYEEAADLTASIAKLRSLLAHEPREYIPSHTSDESWWESSRIHDTQVDTATLADEYDINTERTSPNQTSNNMQRFDKLLARTVTGVFNSLRGAVASDNTDTRTSWNYVCSSMELSLCVSVSRLLGARRAAWRVDAALDSLSHLPPPPPATVVGPDDFDRRAAWRVDAALDSLSHLPPAPPANVGAPDDFDEWCSQLGGSVSSLGSLLVAAGVGSSHVAQRILTILTADVVEELISVWLDRLTEWLKQQIFTSFEQMSEEPQPATDAETTREVDLDVTSRAVVEKISNLQYIVGEEELFSAVKQVLTSFTNKQINKDVIYRTLDLFVLHFKNSAGLRNPSFDVN